LTVSRSVELSVGTVRCYPALVALSRAAAIAVQSNDLNPACAELGLQLGQRLRRAVIARVVHQNELQRPLGLGGDAQRRSADSVRAPIARNDGGYGQSAASRAAIF